MKKVILYLLSFLLVMPVMGKPTASDKKSNNDTGFEQKLQAMHFPDKLKLPEIVIGNSNAPVTLIVYSSFTCSHCRDFHLNVFPKFKKEYVDTGKVKVYLRCFLDDLGALEAAVLMRCFGKSNPSESESIYNAVYSRQKDWLKANDPRNFLKQIFIDLKHSKDEVEKCIVDRKISAGLMEYMQRALKDIHSVPSFVCNNKKHEGSITYEELVEMCELIQH